LAIVLLSVSPKLTLISPTAAGGYPWSRVTRKGQVLGGGGEEHHHNMLCFAEVQFLTEFQSLSLLASIIKSESEQLLDTLNGKQTLHSAHMHLVVTAATAHIQLKNTSIYALHQSI